MRELSVFFEGCPWKTVRAWKFCQFVVLKRVLSMHSSGKREREKGREIDIKVSLQLTLKKKINSNICIFFFFYCTLKTLSTKPQCCMRLSNQSNSVRILWIKLKDWKFWHCTSVCQTNSCRVVQASFYGFVLWELVMKFID